jgi:hypothetical protein
MSEWKGLPQVKGHLAQGMVPRLSKVNPKPRSLALCLV